MSGTQNPEEIDVSSITFVHLTCKLYPLYLENSSFLQQ